MSNYEYEKFVCTPDTLINTINTYGVAIIPNVLDDEECNNIVSGIWDFIEHITQNWAIPISRNIQNTWKYFYKLFPLHSMLIQHWGVGHSQITWDIRQNTKIASIFAKFWDCDINDLLVSFDGVSLHLPPEITNRGWKRDVTGYHTDQSYTVPGFRCIQSFITGLDINEYDATLSVLEKSNLYHEEFKKTFNIDNKSNWYKLTEDEKEFYYSRGCNVKNIKCPKGSLVLWDSRTIHCGIEPNKLRKTPNIRAIIYLCYMKRELATNTDLKKKAKAFAELRTTSHYPCKIKLFPKEPRTYGNELPLITTIPAPILNDLGKRLAGLS
jgi:hypothetical protein